MGKFQLRYRLFFLFGRELCHQGFWLSFIMLLIVLSTTTLHAQVPQDLIPRIAPKPPIHTRLSPADNLDQIILKFREGSGIRYRDGQFISKFEEMIDQIDLFQLNQILTSVGIFAGGIAPLLTRPEVELETERQVAQSRSGRQLADLNLYFSIRIPQLIDIGLLCDTLNSLSFVEEATPAPLPEPPPVDLSPPTPDFSAMQGYREEAPTGIGVPDLVRVPGSDGAGTAIVDIEYSWILDHEDLEMGAEANIDTTATLMDPFDSPNHGTAVLGELGAGLNGYGITGIVPAATLLVAPANTVEFGYNPARAISLATGVLKSGDVILIEQQARVCEGTQFGPLEWHQSVFDVISTATALGITVVEAAGNGSQNLDAPNCLERFNKDVRDSGAIIVGAGSPTDSRRLSFSSYGSRVDLQGWGTSVTTAGYGDLFNPGDNRQYYTSNFNGTSSASAIVAGAALAVQGVQREMGLAPYNPVKLRHILVETGTSQTGSGEHIGPLPNIQAALERSEDEISVAVDILPRRCPNRITVGRRHSRKGVRAAILGTENFDVYRVAVNSIRLGGAAPIGGSLPNATIRDMATPYEPFLGKRDEEDCSRERRDGFDDLTLTFESREILARYGPLADGDVVVLPLTGHLLDGTPIRGEEVVVIRARRR